MRKFYSIVLMAAALLVGTNVWATTVATVTLQGETEDIVLNYESLDEALAAVNTRAKIKDLGGKATSVVTVQLQADAILSTGIVIQSGNGKNNKMVLDLNGHNINANSYILVYVAYLEVTGQGSIYLNGGNVFYVYGYSAEAYSDISHLVIDSNVKVITPSSDDWAICIFSDKPSDTTYRKYAYGVIIDIYGEIYGAITINGNVNYVSNYQPHINVYEGGSMTVSETLSCIYAAGYGIWNIQGTLTGGGCIYAKAGEITLDGATLTATGAYAEPKGWGGGYNLTGDAIVYDSYKGGYAEDGMKLTVKGETNVSSENGYAIQEVATKGETKLPQLTIESGTFEGAGDKGAILTTDGEKNKLQTEGTISGGNFVNDQNITEYLGIIEGTVVAVTDEAGNTTYVVENIAPEVKSDNLLTAGPTDKVILNHATQTDVTLTADKEVAYLALSGKDKVIIPAGITLKVGNAAIAADGVIDVQLGGRLIVSGDNGIVADLNKNILLAAKEGQMSIFMLNPAVTSNKTPHATVTFETKAYQKDATPTYQYERIGVPAFNGMKVSEIKANPATAGIMLAYWGETATGQDWIWITSTSYVLQPFQGFAMTNAATAPGTKYIFPCQLMGNEDATLNFSGEWASFSNSYFANVDLKAMLQAVKEGGAGVNAAAYVYRAADDWWDNISLQKLLENGAAQTQLAPMQGFVFNNLNDGAPVSANIIYKDVIWDPVFNPSPIAARKRTADNMTRAYITITAENGQSTDVVVRQSNEFSAEFDNGCDVKANLNINPISIYATTELGNLAEVSTDNLDGIKLSVATKSATSFKMTFSNLNGEQLAIRDNLTGATMTMTEDAVYCFNMAEGTASERFEIVSVKNAPTDVETVVETEGAKAVYTVLGQYMGTTDNWNTLPAGIYVIDGVKMVK